MGMQKNKSSRTSLSEFESKTLLKEFGIPVVGEAVAATPEEAVKAAQGIGFPVVLKGMGKNLLHKTERGLVHLGLGSPDDVLRVTGMIAGEAGDDLESFLVQPMVSGQREFVAGLFRDRQFGPVVMFGLGGIFTEALNDAVFRLAPLTRRDAEDMVDGIKAQKLLGAFRGEAAADREKLIESLLGLSAMAEKYPEISEVDINPLMVTPRGDVMAVDALIIKDEKQAGESFPPPVPPERIGYFFHPKPIVFVGASSHIGKWGHSLLTNTVSGGFKGEIYLVNPRGGTIAGKKVYKTVSDIPGEVDLAVVTIPAHLVMDLIPQFKEKGIKDMLLISSGFAETGDAGRVLEKELVEKAAEAGIMVMGPNTMGICNPHINLYCTGAHVRPDAGSTLIMSQSGNMGVQLLAFSEQQGIGVRGFCGSGNEAMITIEDVLEAAGKDSLTKSIMMYVESVKNGRRFFELAREIGKKKPIVLMKGGESEAGNLAAASHTGAMTSDSKVFSAMCDQAGIIKIRQSMDMLDLAAAFSSLPLPRGNRAAIMTLGGGWGVITADLCSHHGIEVPELTPGIVASMDKVLPPYWSRANPVDLVGENDLELPFLVTELLMKWDGCDAVINMGMIGKRFLSQRLTGSILNSDPSYTKEFLDQAVDVIRDFEKRYIEHVVRLMDKYGKPVYGVSLLTEDEDKTVYSVPDSDFKGVFYPTPERAVKAFSGMCSYERFLNRS